MPEVNLTLHPKQQFALACDANEIGSSFIEGPIFYGLTTFTGIEWIPEEVGTFEIYVVIDPESDTSDSKIGLIVESDEGNNYASVTVNVIKLLRVPYFFQVGKFF